MIPKYDIEYTLEFGKHVHAHHYATDDPVACEEILVALLERGLTILSIKHEGLFLERREFDALVRTAAHTLAAKHVAASLHLNAEEVHYRFGLAA
jgi:hypothetical protein